MKKLQTYYRPEQSLAKGAMTSNRKPAQVIEAAGDRLLINDFPVITAEQLKRVHDPKYVDRIFALEEDNGFGHRDPEELLQALAHCGSFLAAAYAALEHRITFSPSQGFHHAGYNFGGGYCTFNGLMVAADALVSRGHSVAIIDGDGHWGNGTDDILKKLPDLARYVHHIPLGRIARKMRNADDTDSMEAELLEVLREASHSDVVFYQAGADAHIADPYGAGYLSTRSFVWRDRLLFGTLARYNTPVVFNLAGGYQPDDKVIDLHLATIDEAHKKA